ncbi:MAG: NAD(P)H-dependent oxidoreductase [Nanoarchaeota archaeon]
MKTLIIYAHPDTGGHSAAILTEVEKQLKSAKTKYEIIDLYAIKYDPVLHEDEHYTAGKDRRNVSEQNKAFQSQIAAADKLIFIYPIWWNGMPAILKGWIDRVFTPYFAYKFVGKHPIIGGRPVGLLKGKRAAIFTTTSSHRLVTALILRNRFKSNIRSDILGFFGIKARVWHIDKAFFVDDKQQRRIEKAVKRGLHWL